MFTTLFYIFLIGIIIFLLFVKITDMLKSGYSMKDILVKIGVGLVFWPVCLVLIALLLTFSLPLFIFGFIAVLVWILSGD